MILDDFKGEDGLWVKQPTVGGLKCKTVSYSRWSSMKGRCTVGGSAQRHRPSYIGCTYSVLFSSFDKFTDWHITQIGYGVQGYHLDKDILVKGNDVYCEDVCVLVPHALNCFLVTSQSRRGKYPQGVSLNRLKNSFRSNMNVCGRMVHLGLFKTPEEASAAYKVAKEAEAYRWYERLRDGEFVVDPRVIERMRTWTFEESV